MLAESRFLGRDLPVPAQPVGYAHCVRTLGIEALLPYRLHAIAQTQLRERTDEWIIHPNTRNVPQTLVGHLIFALRYEGVNLLVLKSCFAKLDAVELIEAIRAKPSSAYLRRLCFFYEWLMEERLDLPVLGGNYVDAIDTSLQYASKESVNDTRLRVRDNLPGTPAFCPLVMRTNKLDAYLDAALDERARAVLRDASPELLQRAAAFLMLKDSRASFQIEKETPPQDRERRWARTIGRAGDNEVTIEHLEQLQREIIGDDRMVQLGLRTEGGFVGEHDEFGQPKPDHIDAKPEDLADLLDGLAAYDRKSAAADYPAVLAATTLAFGFVYIHPFEDGNGRIHRYLIHHVLAARHFSPEGIVFPVSVAILDDILRYRQVLESVSTPLLALTEWRPTDRGNVEVLNDTADYFRFFDATPHAEFLFERIERTIDVDLREELRFLEIRDRFHQQGTRILDMPARTLDLLFRMLRQNGGQFSQRMREREFAPLKENEIVEFERLYNDLVQPEMGPPAP